MGGFGSGRWTEKLSTHDMQGLHILHLHRRGLLEHGQEFECQRQHSPVVASIRIAVSRDGAAVTHHEAAPTSEQPPLRYTVPIDWSACRFGGQRPWWRCPAVGCERRVAVLYIGRVLACRHCYSLTYRSRREAPDGRASRRADVIRRQLGWPPGIANGLGPRPKGMHRETFHALLAQHEQCVGKALVYGALRHLE
jgi:hypothetical protein